MDIKKERRHRKAVELICEKLQITDIELDAYIAGKKAQIIDSEPMSPTAKEVAVEISKCSTLDELKEFKDDTRQIVKAAYKKKLIELE